MGKGGFNLQTLVIYDTTGFILSQMQGSSLREPVGIPFLWVTIPDGKRLKSIDITVTPNVPVYENIPETEIQVLRSDNTDVSEIMLDLGIRIAILEGGT